MHPGELLREEILPALARPKTEIAKLLGVSRQTLYDIIDEKQPVTATMALRLGKLCGNGPDLWLNLQKRYDLQRAEQGGQDQEHPDIGRRLTRRLGAEVRSKAGRRSSSMRRRRALSGSRIRKRTLVAHHAAGS